MEVLAISLGKDLQWGIEAIEDPVEAAMRANEALLEFNRAWSDNITPGTNIMVRAMGAYAFNQYREGSDRPVQLRFDPIVASGEFGGLGFIQNIFGNLRLQTLFIGLHDTSVQERIEHGAVHIAEERVDRLVVPILDVAEVRVAA